ncbi:MAG: T9SS type A sorting domain-containing protein [Bacteroidetes bacterium]|nr:T9SS type A sorting domain-containing protein [Bacteroidota bacterium]
MRKIHWVLCISLFAIFFQPELGFGQNQKAYPAGIEGHSAKKDSTGNIIVGANGSYIGKMSTEKAVYRAVVYYDLSNTYIPANSVLKSVKLSYNANSGSTTSKIVTLNTYSIPNNSTHPDWYKKIATGDNTILESVANNDVVNELISNASQNSTLFNLINTNYQKSNVNDRYIAFGVTMNNDEKENLWGSFTLNLEVEYEPHFLVTIKNSFNSGSIYVDDASGTGFVQHNSGKEFKYAVGKTIQIKSSVDLNLNNYWYFFTNWTSNKGGTQTANPFSLTVSKDEIWTANFDQKVKITFANQEGTANLDNSYLKVGTEDNVKSGEFRYLVNNSAPTIQTKHETWDNKRLKHNNWNDLVSEYKMGHSITVNANKIIDLAKFKELKPVTVASTLESVQIPGPVEVKDPWYVDGSGNQPETWVPYASGFNSATMPNGGVFLQSQSVSNPQYPYYKIRVPQTANFSGLDGSFQNWSSSNNNVTNSTSPETPVVFRSPNDLITANYKAMMASKTGGWVQSQSPYTANGTSAVAYFSSISNGNPGLWFHQENGSVVKEVNIGAEGLGTIDLSNASNLLSVAVADYNKQKSYIGFFGYEPGNDKILAIGEVVNGYLTGFNQVMEGYIDAIVDGLSLNAKLYITPYTNLTGFPASYNKFLVVVVDGLTVYTRAATMSNGLVSNWEPWSSFTVNSTPVFSTNGKTPYITWIHNGNLVGRKYHQTNWVPTYTLYSNSGGNFINFAATVNSTDDLILMMTRQNSLNSRSMCFGKRYYSGSLAPVTVLETMGFSLYNAYSLAAENGKILASIGKSSPDGEVFNYFLWKHDGTRWTKETTAFSSTPARLLHNEVDVRPYEFVTSTTPALYALKTAPVSWPAGNPGMNKEGDENGFSIVAAQIGDTLNWYTTVSPEAVDSIVVDSTGIWSIVVNQVSAKNILISGLNRFGSAIWVDTSSTVLFAPATARYTFWVVDPAGNKMRVHKESSESDEAEFVLENKISVFPNPFNPTTVFSVSVAEPSTVKLHVFNLIGQQIAEVVNADLNAGVHDYRLNAGSWSSGTYFYRLQIGEKTKTGKIQLVK